MITNDKDNISYCSDGSYDTTDDETSTTSVSSTKEEQPQELVLSKEANQGKLAFGNIAVVNSSNVHFGNKTVYEGPVTIKQFLYAKPQIISDLNDGHNKFPHQNKYFVPDSVNSNNHINLGFRPSETTITNKNNNGNSNAPDSEIKKDLQWLRNILRQHLPLILSLSALLLLSLIVLMSVLLTKHRNVVYPFPVDTNEQDQNSPAGPDTNVNFTLPPKLKIDSRQQWLARPSYAPLKRLSKPVPYVIIMETQTENCTLFSDCVYVIKNKQTYDIDSLKKPDISYNFLIGGDGSAYEGVGWDCEGTHTSAYNNRSVGIAFIGTFSHTSPHKRQITAAKRLITIGVNSSYINSNYKLLGNRQLENSQNPGTLLFEEIKNWENWIETP